MEELYSGPAQSERPSHSARESMRELILAFGSAVTISSHKTWVARKGSESLHAAFNQFLISSELHKGISPSLSRSAFNKILEASGQDFICVRTRRRNIDRSAGNWLFAHRRWLNPNEAADAQILSGGYDLLKRKFPSFTKTTRAGFLAIVADAGRRWSCKLSHRRGDDPEGAFDRSKDSTGDSDDPPSSGEGSTHSDGGGSANPLSDQHAGPPPTPSAPPPPLRWGGEACAASSNLPFATAPALLAPPHTFWQGPVSAGHLVDLALHAHWECGRTLCGGGEAELERYAEDEPDRGEALAEQGGEEESLERFVRGFLQPPGGLRSFLLAC